MSASLAVLVASGLTVVASRIPQPTYATFQMQTTVATRSSRTGDPVSLVADDAFVIDGVAIARGSAAQGVVVRAVRPGRVRGRGEIEIAIESVTAPGGRVIPVRGSVVIDPPPQRRASPAHRPPPPTVPILAGMVAGYGTSALVSEVSNSTETIAGAGVIAGLSTGILVGVLKRGEDWIFPRGETFVVSITPVREP
jgi:hypothetical protein